MRRNPTRITVKAGATAGRARRSPRRAALASAVVIAFTVAAVALPASAAGGGGGGGGGGAGAAATVGNGLTTTDLSAVGMSPASLASDLVGPGVTVSNVTYSGANAQAGLIHVVDPAVVSFNDGVILSSGNIADVVGPNKSDSITGDLGGPADADLNALIANTQTVNPVTFDAASLEFDFVPTANQVYFTYTFASDEYLEWVNLFNDVFAFYVNGQNCATVPNGDPVSIDTINNAVNPSLFRDNSFSSPPANPINIEPDGLSVEMICSAPVNPGQTNHMKLAIADTSDQVLDSVVMIKAQSLSTTKPESCNDGVDNDDDLLVDNEDPSCQATTTPPPPGSGGTGSSNNAPPFTGNEGTAIVLDASALDWTPSGDTLTTSWTVTGINGTPGTCPVTPAGRLPLNSDGSIAVVTAVCPNEGEYVARVDGWDIEGGSAWDSDVDFFVHNAPPVVTIDLPAPATQVAASVPVTVSASVADPGVNDSFTCSISWGDGTTGPGSIGGGSCTGTHAYADLGPQVVAVTATDDAGDSAAAKTVLTVVAAGTSVSSDANPSVTGQPVTLSAATTLGATGKMSFYDGATLLGTKAVSGGTASLTTTKLGVGSHPITASYKKTSTSTPSISAALDQQVAAAATSTTVSSSANPAVAGQSVKLRVAVTTDGPGTGTPAGSVDLFDNGVLVTSHLLGGGAAVIPVKPAVGLHAYTASYGGSASSLPSTTDAALAQQVDPATTSVTVSSTVNPSVFGQALSIKATVKAVLPGSGAVTGTVDFFDDGAFVATKTITNGVSAAVSLKPSVGPHTYTATYSGSDSHLGGSSAPLVQFVGPASTKITLVSSFPTTTFGHSGSITAAVSALAPGAGQPTGSVNIYDDGSLIATVALASGKAKLQLASLAVGVHVITAAYTADTNFGASLTTTALTQTIT